MYEETQWRGVEMFDQYQYDRLLIQLLFADITALVSEAAEQPQPSQRTVLFS